MKSKSIVLLLLVFAVQLQAQVTRPVGINISYVADYSTELVFTNAFLQCRDWISCNANNTGPWDTQVSVPLRPDGYPLELPYDDGVNLPQKLKTLMIWDLFFRNANRYISPQIKRYRSNKIIQRSYRNLQQSC